MTTIPATLHGPNPLPPSAGLASSNATLTDVLGMIRRRLLSIILLFVAFGSMACGGFYVWWVYLPTYSAVGLIECVTSVPRESLAIADERLPDREHERFVSTPFWPATTCAVPSGSRTFPRGNPCSMN